MGYALLFSPASTSFDTQGLGVLTDMIRCEVTEELNGEFELEMDYPVTGIHFSEIGTRSIILCDVNQESESQAFRVYKISEPLNGVVTIYARHISYDLSGYPLQPFATFTDLAEALTELVTHTNTVIEAAIPFTFSFDENVEGNFAVDAPSSLRSWLGGRDGSILDVFGGEWIYNNFSCRLVRHRGSDRGATIRYGKNLKSVEWNTDDESQYTDVWGYYAYIFEKEQDQEDAEARCLGANIKSVTEYYAAGTSKTTPPATSEFVSKEDWEEDDSKKVSVTKDLPYLWNYEEYEYENGNTGSTSPQLVGHYGWTTIDATEGQIDDFDVEYDEFGNSLVPYEHTAKSEPLEYYALSSSSSTEPPEEDEEGKKLWKTSVPKATEDEPYLWNRSLTHRSAKKEMIIFSDIISTGTYDYKKILTVDLSDEFEAPPTKEQINAFLRNYIQKYNLASKNLEITLDFAQIDEIIEPIFIGDTLTVYFNDEEREIRVNRVVWDVLKERYSSIEVGSSAYAGAGDAFAKYAASNNSGGKYGSSGMLAYFDNGYIRADTVEARVVKAEEGIFEQLRSNYASFNYLEANYADIETLVSTYATIESLNAQNAVIQSLEADTAKIHNLTAESLEASVGYIDELASRNITAQSIQAAITATGTLATNYAAIDFANVDTADISSAWVDELMVQSQFIVQSGQIYDLTALRINANDIQTGTMTADRLQLRGNDGLYYVLNYDALGQSTWEALTPEEQAALKQHIHADTILAHSITTDHLTANNLVGTGGWINLANGTFEYQNATSGNGITWDGTHLNINADSLTIGSRTVEEVASENSGINRMPSVYLYEDFYGKIFEDEDHGITWTVNQDGSVTATGTATGVARYIFTSCLTDDSVPAMMIDPDKKYTISGCPEGNTAGSPNYWIGGRLYDEETTPSSAGGVSFSDTGSGFTTATDGYRYITIYAQIKDGYTIPSGGITFYPMLESGETKHNYVSTHDGSGSMVDRIGIAEAKIEVNSDNIALKVSKDGLISEINTSAESIGISSSKINLTGSVTFQDLETAAQDALVTGVSSKNQYYLSSSSSSVTGGSWQDTQPVVTSGKYLWTRVAVTKIYANEATRTEYSTAVYDANLTASLTASSNASTAAGTAVASTVSVYYRSTTNSTPSISTSSTIATSGDTDNSWDYVMPSPKNGRYYYTCERYTLKNGSVTFSAVRPMTNLNYTAMWCSANNATLIDGSHIATGTISANKIDADGINANMIKAGRMSADRISGGTIDISGGLIFRLPSAIADEGNIDVFQLSGTEEGNATVNIRSIVKYRNKDVSSALFYLGSDQTVTGRSTGYAVSATNISGQAYYYTRSGRVVTAGIIFTASAAVNSAVKILKGLPIPRVKSGYTESWPRALGTPYDGWGLAGVVIDDEGYVRARASASGTYYVWITYITSDD